MAAAPLLVPLVLLLVGARSWQQRHIRRARRDLKNLVQDETRKEKEREAEDARVAAIEAGFLQLNAQDMRPTRSVGVVAHFIARSLVERLPAATCQGCGERLLAADPAAAVAVSKAQRATRVYCGCWWHRDCLNTVLTTPPFGMQGCSGCRERRANNDGDTDRDDEVVRIWHHDWSRDIKKHEKQWAREQARQREIQEVADAFGMMSGPSSSEEDDDEDE